MWLVCRFWAECHCQCRGGRAGMKHAMRELNRLAHVTIRSPVRVWRKERTPRMDIEIRRFRLSILKS